MFDEVDVPLPVSGLNVRVARGETADFDEELAQSLLEQTVNWELGDELAQELPVEPVTEPTEEEVTGG